MSPLQTTLNYEIITTSQTPKTTVIWLHGLGADGHDFAPIVPELHCDHTKFIFPHAPVRPITLNGGFPMRAWFDIPSLSFDSEQDEQGIRESAQQIEQLIQQEIIAGIDSQHIILAGFSQGGAMALHCGLRFVKPLGGIIALSTFLPLAQTVPHEKHTANQQIPIFLAHGNQDPLVPLLFGEMTKQWLQQENYSVAWHTYPMEHAVCAAEVDDISTFLQPED